MFTGIVETTGLVVSMEDRGDLVRLVIRAPFGRRRIAIGASIAVNGCCLTVVACSGAGSERTLEFDLLRETCRLTNLSMLRTGDVVNVERALGAAGDFSGHLVTGHVDGTGRLRTYEPRGGDHLLEVEADMTILRYVVLKGSITVDGISLTVAETLRDGFRIWIIPHTHQKTNLRVRKIGDLVNLEPDILGKYVERFVNHFQSAPKSVAQGVAGLG